MHSCWTKIWRYLGRGEDIYFDLSELSLCRPHSGVWRPIARKLIIVATGNPNCFSLCPIITSYEPDRLLIAIGMHSPCTHVEPHQHKTCAAAPIQKSCIATLYFFGHVAHLEWSTYEEYISIVIEDPNSIIHWSLPTMTRVVPKFHDCHIDGFQSDHKYDLIKVIFVHFTHQKSRIWSNVLASSYMSLCWKSLKNRPHTVSLQWYTSIISQNKMEVSCPSQTYDPSTKPLSRLYTYNLSQK